MYDLYYVEIGSFYCDILFLLVLAIFFFFFGFIVHHCKGILYTSLVFLLMDSKLVCINIFCYYKLTQMNRIIYTYPSKYVPIYL